jgi:alkylation response protein AidB-like acyl-CoA dehydrogenase
LQETNPKTVGAPARMLLYDCARMKDASMNIVKEAAMAKLFCSQVAERVAFVCVEIYGGYGFTKDYPIEKYFRASKIGKIYEGTSNMQLQTIAKSILSAYGKSQAGSTRER